MRGRSCSGSAGSSRSIVRPMSGVGIIVPKTCTPSVVVDPPVEGPQPLHLAAQAERQRRGHQRRARRPIVACDVHRVRQRRHRPRRRRRPPLARMVVEVGADEPVGVAEPVREVVRPRAQQQHGRVDGAGGDDDGAGADRAAHLGQRVDVVDRLDAPAVLDQFNDDGVGVREQPQRRRVVEQRLEHAAVAVELRAPPGEHPRAALGERHRTDPVAVTGRLGADHPPLLRQPLAVAADAGGDARGSGRRR